MQLEQTAPSRVREVYVIILTDGPTHWESTPFEDPSEAFDKVDELQANGHEPKVVRRWIA